MSTSATNKEKKTHNTIFSKLQEARAILKKTPLKKTGHNKFSGYYYFELQDFLPTITDICNDLGICCIPTFSQEYAELKVFDVNNKEDFIVLQSPMVEITMKGCNEVQNLGAVETYQRRYLYMNAFEIVENDLSESMTGANLQQEKKQPTKTSSSKGIAKEETKTNNAKTNDNVKLLQDIQSLLKKADQTAKTNAINYLTEELKLKVQDLKNAKVEDLQKFYDFLAKEVK